MEGHGQRLADSGLLESASLSQDRSGKAGTNAWALGFASSLGALWWINDG